MIYADNGINWEFLYEVQYEDNEILILKDLGRFHKFDEDQMYKGKIDKYIELGHDYVRIDNKLKLVEVL